MKETEIDEIITALRKSSQRSIIVLLIISIIGAIGGLIGIATFIITVIK